MAAVLAKGTTTIYYAACEPYFATHFPYKPCVPGVMLLTFMGDALRDALDPRKVDQ